MWSSQLRGQALRLRRSPHRSFSLEPFRFTPAEPARDGRRDSLWRRSISPVTTPRMADVRRRLFKGPALLRGSGPGHGESCPASDLPHRRSGGGTSGCFATAPPGTRVSTVSTVTVDTQQRSGLAPIKPERRILGCPNRPDPVHRHRRPRPATGRLLGLERAAGQPVLAHLGLFDLPPGSVPDRSGRLQPLHHRPRDRRLARSRPVHPHPAGPPLRSLAAHSDDPLDGGPLGGRGGAHCLSVDVRRRRTPLFRPAPVGPVDAPAVRRGAPRAQPVDVVGGRLRCPHRVLRGVLLDLRRLRLLPRSPPGLDLGRAHRTLRGHRLDLPGGAGPDPPARRLAPMAAGGRRWPPSVSGISSSSPPSTSTRARS